MKAIKGHCRDLPRLQQQRQRVMCTGGAQVFAAITVFAEYAVWDAVPRAQFGCFKTEDAYKKGGPVPPDCPLIKALLPGVEVERARLGMDRGSGGGGANNRREVGGKTYYMRGLAVETRGKSPIGAALALQLLAALPASVAGRRADVGYRKSFNCVTSDRQANGTVREVQAKIAERRRTFVEETGGAVRQTGCNRWITQGDKDTRDVKREK